MENDSIIIKKWFKKIKPIYVVSFFLVVCLVFISWQFGIKKWEAKIYSRGQTDLIGQPLTGEQLASFINGFQAGQILLNNSIVQQYQQSGGISINIPDQNGEIKTIFLKP